MNWTKQSLRILITIRQAIAMTYERIWKISETKVVFWLICCKLAARWYPKSNRDLVTVTYPHKSLLKISIAAKHYWGFVSNVLQAWTFPQVVTHKLGRTNTVPVLDLNEHGRWQHKRRFCLYSVFIFMFCL